MAQMDRHDCVLQYMINWEAFQEASSERSIQPTEHKPNFNADAALFYKTAEKMKTENNMLKAFFYSMTLATGWFKVK